MGLLWRGGVQRTGPLLTQATAPKGQCRPPSRRGAQERAAEGISRRPGPLPRASRRCSWRCWQPFYTLAAILWLAAAASSPTKLSPPPPAAPAVLSSAPGQKADTLQIWTQAGVGVWGRGWGSRGGQLYGWHDLR